MRIAMIGLRGIPAKYSGVETAVEEIGARMVEQGHDVFVYCMSSTQDAITTSYRGMRRIFIPTIRSKNLEMIVYSALATLHAIFGRYDIIHFQALGPSNMAFLCWLAGRTAVVTCHGLDYRREKWGALARGYLRLGEYVSARYAGEVITVSRSLQRHFADARHRQATYIPNGSLKQTRTELGQCSERFGILPKKYVVFVGRLVECKRVDHLIHAFRHCETNLKLVLAGDGPPEIVGRLRELANGDDRIVFTGHLHGSELAAVFSNAALYVLPSVLEGLPLSLIEALAYDLPVVVSDIPENLEVVTDGKSYRATVVKSDDQEALRRGLGAAIAALTLTGDSTTGNADFVLAKYNWNRICQETLASYARALTGHGRKVTAR